MVSDLSQDAAYLTLEYISIVLFLYMLVHCIYHSINYLLQVFSVVAICNNINETAILLYYKGHVVDNATCTVGCTVSAIFERYLSLVLTFLASCIGFNVWFMVVYKSHHTERQLLKWYCFVSFGVPLIATIIAVILLKDEPNWTAYPRRYYYDLTDTSVTMGAFCIPMLLSAFIGIFFAMYTTIFLALYFFKLRRTLNSRPLSSRNIVLDGSYCIRLIIFSLAFGVVTVMAVLQEVIQFIKDGLGESNSSKLATLSDFSGSLVGFFVFLVFGTTLSSLSTMTLVYRPCQKSMAARKLRGAKSEGEEGSQDNLHIDLEVMANADSADSAYTLSFEEIMVNTPGSSEMAAQRRQEDRIPCSDDNMRIPCNEMWLAMAKTRYEYSSFSGPACPAPIKDRRDRRDRRVGRLV